MLTYLDLNLHLEQPTVSTYSFWESHMQIRCLHFIVKFLLILRFGKGLFNVITRNHGSSGTKLVFHGIDIHKKLSKAELDVDFLKTCKTYDIFPTFLRFNPRPCRGGGGWCNPPP